MDKLKQIPSWLLALAGAVLMWLFWPPLNLGLLLPLGFAPWLILAEKLNDKHRLHQLKYYMYFALFMWNLFCTWWVWYASPGGAVAMLFANTLLMTIPWIFYAWIRKRSSKRYAYLGLVGAWLSLELMQLNWDGNYPWMNLGNGLARWPEIIQWYEYTGTLGGSLWILVCSILLVEVILHKDRAHGFKFGLVYLVPILISVLLFVSYSSSGEKKEVVILQPNLDPYEEKFSMSPISISTIMSDMAKEEISSNTDLLLLPETAIPGNMDEKYINNKRKVRILLDLLIEYPEMSILSGAETYEYIYADKKPTSTAKFETEGVYYDLYNTALLLERFKEPQIYHKSKLVPGPEKVPFSSLFKFLEKWQISIPGGAGTLGISPEAKNLEMKSGIVGAPLICYESVFGEYTTEFINKGANALFIITNDAWWDETDGHRQHLLYGSVRAIETRRDIARAANTGISAFINQKGQIVQKTNWWERVSLKGEIQLNDAITFYTRFGDYIGYLGFCLFIGLLGFVGFKGIKKA